MSKLKLYSDLAEIYDQLYLSIFNYKEDAEFVDSILKRLWGASETRIPS